MLSLRKFLSWINYHKKGIAVVLSMFIAMAVLSFGTIEISRSFYGDEVAQKVNVALIILVGVVLIVHKRK